MTRSRGPGAVRVIGGRWRGRRIVVPDVPGLRPTPDRVRETLFNWLAPALPGSRCLDICAGSGALGFEAASRGASSVTLVERQPAVVSTLREQALRLNAHMLEIIAADALTWLQGPPRTFDIVFLDPPFGQGQLARYLELLSQRDWLSPRAHVYLETELDEPVLPEGWQLSRSRRAGHVRYHLALTTG